MSGIPALDARMMDHFDESKCCHPSNGNLVSMGKSTHSKRCTVCGKVWFPFGDGSVFNFAQCIEDAPVTQMEDCDGDHMRQADSSS